LIDSGFNLTHTLFDARLAAVHPPGAAAGI
jgi:hypothetical protein